MTARTFEAIRILRRTGETEFAVVLRPGRSAELPLPNRILAHFLDHFGKASGIELVLKRTDWPGSWAFDHVLCEDMGQLVGKGVREIHNRTAALRGVPGRASASTVMDDARVDLTLSFEERPRALWDVADGVAIDGFIDSWYEGDRMVGSATGTNLRQFLDGFALGAGATIHVRVVAATNLHHLYEAIFRALGDAVGTALDLDVPRRPGSGSGLAGPPIYEIGAPPPEIEP